MFCVGDIVVYGAHGLCKVDGIGPLPMKFADKSKRYYTLHTCKQPSMTIYAPVDNQTVVMRQPLNRAQGIMRCCLIIFSLPIAFFCVTI